MEETIYGIQVVRKPAASAVDRLGTIQFWKSWPDGARCKMLELQPEEVPSRGSRLTDGTKPWRKLVLPRGGRYTFDPERDWWVAPGDIEALVMWVVSHDSPEFMTVVPRHGPS